MSATRNTEEIERAARSVLERIREIYRQEYIELAAKNEPDSLLGRCKRLENALREMGDAT